MDNLDEIIKSATAKIECKYFQLPIDGGVPIYRERVYCYELYHQMRMAWPDTSCYTLNGEVDKSAHPTLSKYETKNKVPDLLVHGPGQNNLNHAIIEVKKEDVTLADCKKDLQKISHFMDREACYDRGIFLIFGFRAEIISTLARSAGDGLCLRNVEIWVHDGPMREARRVHQFI